MAPDPASLVGRSYGPGEFTVEQWLAHLWADATRNGDDAYRRSDADGVQYAPPTLAQVVAREAAGTGDIEADLRGGDWADPSVFLGGTRLSVDRPLRAGETYRATAEIVGAEEKDGSSGPFRVVTVAYDVETADGAPAFDLETDLVVREDG